MKYIKLLIVVGIYKGDYPVYINNPRSRNGTFCRYATKSNRNIIVYFVIQRNQQKVYGEQKYIFI